MSREDARVIIYRDRYRMLRRQLRALIYENEDFQDQMRRAQCKLIQLANEKSHLLDRVARLENPDGIPDASEADDAPLFSDDDADAGYIMPIMPYPEFQIIRVRERIPKPKPTDAELLKDAIKRGNAAAKKAKPKPKVPKPQVPKRKPTKRETAKRETVKRQPAKRKTVKINPPKSQTQVKKPAQQSRSLLSKIILAQPLREVPEVLKSLNAVSVKKIRSPTESEPEVQTVPKKAKIVSCTIVRPVPIEPIVENVGKINEPAENLFDLVGVPDFSKEEIPHIVFPTEDEMLHDNAIKRLEMRQLPSELDFTKSTAFPDQLLSQEETSESEEN